MVEGEKVNRRFQKSLRFSDEEKLSSELREIFGIFQPEDFRRELRVWRRMALSNDQSAYDRGESREDLIDFAMELNKLIGAFYLLYRTEELFSPRKIKRATLRLEQKVNDPGVMTVWLTEPGGKNPYSVINHFCESFSVTHARAELLDILDAVITYEGYRKMFKTNLVLMYRCLLVLITVAYRLYDSEILKMQGVISHKPGSQ